MEEMLKEEKKREKEAETCPKDTGINLNGRERLTAKAGTRWATNNESVGL